MTEASLVAAEVGGSTPPSPTSHPPVLVGEANPRSGDERLALYPRPRTSAGGRLCHSIFRMAEREYLRAFDRVNLCPRAWCDEDARERAADVFALAKRRGQSVVLLGARVSRAFGFDFEPFSVRYVEGARVLTLPHPSGRCRAWNDPAAVRRARRLVGLMRGEGVNGDGG